MSSRRASDADDELQQMDRHAVLQGAEDQDDKAKQQQRCRSAKGSRPPAAQGRDGKDDRESLDNLDQGRNEGRA